MISQLNLLMLLVRWFIHNCFCKRRLSRLEARFSWTCNLLCCTNSSFLCQSVSWSQYCGPIKKYFWTFAKLLQYKTLKGFFDDNVAVILHHGNFSNGTNWFISSNENNFPHLFFTKAFSSFSFPDDAMDPRELSYGENITIVICNL